MRKYLAVLLSVVLLSCAWAADSFAQSRFGVIGGMTFSTSKAKDINRSTMTQWHAGITAKIDLPAGFSIQPSLLYNVKGAKTQQEITQSNRFDVSMGYLELPVSVQWGPDLLVFRPFLDVTPYIGYALNNKLVKSGPDVGNTTDKNTWSGSGLRRFEYGLGLGVGLEIWRFQVIGRYNWNFGSIYKGGSEDNDFSSLLKGAFDDRNFGGITLSVAFLFGGGRR